MRSLSNTTVATSNTANGAEQRSLAILTVVPTRPAELQRCFEATPIGGSTTPPPVLVPLAATRRASATRRLASVALRGNSTGNGNTAVRDNALMITLGDSRERGAARFTQHVGGSGALGSGPFPACPRGHQHSGGCRMPARTWVGAKAIISIFVSTLQAYAGDNNTIRIGNSDITTTFIRGISGANSCQRRYWTRGCKRPPGYGNFLKAI